MNLKTAVVTTTINIPYFLEDLSHNAQKFKHSNIKFYIIGDLKTPLEIKDYIKELSLKFNFELEFYEFTEPFPQFQSTKIGSRVFNLNFETGSLILHFYWQ